MTPYAWMRRIRDRGDMTPATKGVAMAIGLRADKHGECWPSYERLASDTGFSRRTVIREIARLKHAGLLVVVPRTNGHGHQSNSYALTYPQPNGADTPEVVTQEHHLVTQGHPLGSDTGTPRRSKPKEEQKPTPTTPVDNHTLAALLNGMNKQHRIPD